MYTLNGWWFLSSGGAYPPVFTVDVSTHVIIFLIIFIWIVRKATAVRMSGCAHLQRNNNWATMMK